MREQLTKVTEERERWKEEQLEIQKKVLDSQQQFEKVREGFKSKCIICFACNLLGIYAIRLADGYIIYTCYT